MTLKDFIYFDVNKATSILSQLEDGLVKEFNRGVEETEDDKTINKFNLHLWKPEFGDASSNKNSIIETGIFHHDLFNKLEKQLNERNFVATIMERETNIEKVEQFRSLLSDKFYVKAEGKVLIEDFSKIKFIAERFNNITSFISQCTTSSIEEQQEYVDYMTSLEKEREEAKKIKDKNIRKRRERELNKREKEFKDTIKNNLEVQGIEEWLIDGIIYFIDTFIVNRINLRVYPYSGLPYLQILSNLKRECFVDSDLENLLFAYGSRPNIKLSVFGLITSIPEKSNQIFSLEEEYEFYPTEEQGDEIVFEKAFRQVFSSMEEFEGLVRFSRYPNITIYPIAVYRDIG